MSERFLSDRVELHCGDCREVLATLPENSLDACVTDPPYHLTTGKNGGSGPASLNLNSPAGRSVISTGFMGKSWDGGDIAFDPDTWRAVYRVVKPGAYIVAFGSSRNYHRMACAIEDAGFITHPLIGWVTGQGFPKAHSVSKHIDRMAGRERDIIRTAKYRDIRNGHGRGLGDGINASARGGPKYIEHAFTAPATDAAKQWDGWYYGTQSLKPALEPIYVGQKPFEKGLNGTENILRWGTGAINVDGCRVGVAPEDKGGWRPNCVGKDYGDGTILGKGLGSVSEQNVAGRWPANVVHDGSDEVVAAFPESSGNSFRTSRDHQGGEFEWKAGNGLGVDDSGSAARFFYTSKADADDRLGSKHPTVKPLDLMQWLVRLVCRKGGTVLDPFSGTGTTGEAAWREGMSAVLIEAEPEYQADIRRRMTLALAGPDERQRESIKARNLPRDDGPLFESRESWAEMWAKPFDFLQEPKA